MHLTFFNPKSPDVSGELIGEIEANFREVWRTALPAFEAANASRVALGLKPYMGMQSSLNNALDSQFEATGWGGSGGRYFKGDTWVRVSFRHQMSLGADFFDAMRQSKLEDFNQVVLIYATKQLLKEISPRDGGSLCSFEHATRLMQDFGQIAPEVGVTLVRISN